VVAWTATAGRKRGKARAIKHGHTHNIVASVNFNLDYRRKSETS
jgi:hypothetical protein